MAGRLPNVIYYDDSSDSDYEYPADNESSTPSHDRPSTSSGYFGIDVDVPPPSSDEMHVHPANLLPIYHNILFMERFGTTYQAIDHVINELNGDQDRFQPYIHPNRTIILYDTFRKIALCTTLVVYESKY